MQEIWKPIKGFEGFYEISNLLQIRSVKRNGTNGKVLKQITDEGGYKICCLMVLGKRTNKKVHRLIAENFIPNPHNKATINHIDNNRANNSIENLEWCTIAENNAHMVKQGRHRHNPFPKLRLGIHRDQKTGRYTKGVLNEL